MGFFSDLKEDLNQAVSEFRPDDAPQEAQEGPGQPVPEGTSDDSAPTEQQMANLEEMLQDIDELRIPEEEDGSGEAPSMGITVEEPAPEAEEAGVGIKTEFHETVDPFLDRLDKMEEESARAGGEGLEQELRAAFGASGGEQTAEEYLYQQSVSDGSGVIDKSWVLDLGALEATDENAVITAGMRVKGDILSNGNLDVTGEVIGNVQVSGKLSVTGRIRGNSKAGEIYADSAKITGDLIGDGTVKIGAGSVVRGNIEAASAAIAGAVKGTIDVKGPVVLDASAVVYGDIRAKSVQINNGAKIEGMCTLSYAEQSASKFFEDQEIF